MSLIKSRFVLLVALSALVRPPHTLHRATAETDNDAATVRKLLGESRQLIKDPEKYGLVQAIGLAYARAGDVDLALQTMKSIKAPLQIDVGIRELAVVRADQGDSEGAERLVGMIKDDTKGYVAQKPIAWLEMGNAYAKAGKRERASAAYAEAARGLTDKGYSWLTGEQLAEVAEKQFRLGDQTAAKATFQKAIEYALADKDRYISSIALTQVAETQAATGEVAEALKCLQEIKDTFDVASGTGKVAVVQARRGEFKEAEQTISQIKNAGIAARSWLEIARIQAQKKDRAGARESLAAAIRRGGEMTDVEWTVAFTQDVASLQVEIDEKKEGRSSFEKSLQILEKDDTIRDKEFCYRKLAVAMGKAGFRNLSVATFKKALPLAGMNELGIRSKDLQDIFKTAGISVIAEAQGEAGLYPEAIQTAKTIGDEGQRDITIAKICEQRAQGGDLKGALETAELLAGTSQRDLVDYFVADAELDRGQWQAALKRGLNMEDGYWKGRVLRRAGQVQAATDLEGAMQWCDQQKSPEVRACALLGIAEGLLERQQQKAKAK